MQQITEKNMQLSLWLFAIYFSLTELLCVILFDISKYRVNWKLFHETKIFVQKNHFKILKKNWTEQQKNRRLKEPLQGMKLLEKK